MKATNNTHHWLELKVGSPRWPECPPTFWLRLRHLLCRCGLLVQSHQRQNHLHIQAPIMHFAQDSLECWASSVILETFYYDLWTKCPERKRLITHKNSVCGMRALTTWPSHLSISPSPTAPAYRYSNPTSSGSRAPTPSLSSSLGSPQARFLSAGPPL